MEDEYLGRPLLAPFKFWQGQHSSQSVLGFGKFKKMFLP